MSRPTADLTKYGYVPYAVHPGIEWFRPAADGVPEHDLKLSFTKDGRSGRDLMVLSIDGIPMCVTRYHGDREHRGPGFETAWMGFLSGAYDLWELKNVWLYVVMGEWGEKSLEAFLALGGDRRAGQIVGEGVVPDVSNDRWPQDEPLTPEQTAKLKEILGDGYPYFPNDDGHARCEFEGTLASILYERDPSSFPEEPTGW